MANSGIKGKFAERLKRILFFRKKKNNKTNIDDLEDSKTIYLNFLKVMAVIPGFVYENMKSNTNEKKETSKNEIYNINVNKAKELRFSKLYRNKFSVKSNNNLKLDDLKSKTIKISDNRISNREQIKKIDVDDIKRKQESFYNKQIVQNNEISKDKKDVEKIKQLEKSIINLIKKKLIRTVNELEILQSELYILSEVNGESKVLTECQTELNNVKNMLCKLDKLKEQYDFLRDNYDFEYLLEIDDNNLVDKIIELRDAFGTNEVKALVEDYKILDVYKYLYLKMDDLQEKMTSFEDTKKDELIKLKERDIDFEKLKSDVYNVEYANRNYDYFVKEQNELLKDIDENIDKISSHEQIDYHLKGFNRLFMNSFKYFGLLMVSPLKGIIPSIATETLITGNIIKNLYKNLHWEEERKTVYEAIDYSSLLNNAIGDLESTSRIVDVTLDDLVHLKMKYNDQFRKYQGDFLEYRDIMRKISDMENKILGNKIKIEMMRKRALDQKLANENKLKLVKKLNQ